MRVVGFLLMVAGSVGVAWCVKASFAERRPRDVAYALAAPVALVVTLCGALLLFVPSFF